jgi:hypothetical protein
LRQLARQEDVKEYMKVKLLLSKLGANDIARKIYSPFDFLCDYSVIFSYLLLAIVLTAFLMVGLLISLWYVKFLFFLTASALLFGAFLSVKKSVKNA